MASWWVAPIAVLLAATFAGDPASKPTSEMRASLPKVVSRVVPRSVPERRDTVMVRVVIGVDGRVRGAEIVRSALGYDDVCLKAAREWRFKPAVEHESHRPVEVRLVIPFYIRVLAQVDVPKGS